MITIGLIAPLEPLASEYDAVIADCRCRSLSAVTEAADSHALADVTAAGDLDRLVPAAKTLSTGGADVVVWACTSGSFFGGLAVAESQLRTIYEATSRPTTTTSLALLDCLRTLNVNAIGLLSPYPAEVTDRLIAFLREARVSVVELRSLPTSGPSVSSQLGAEQLSSEVAAFGEVPIVVVPDTAILGCSLWPTLETEVPVVFANQWTLWRALCLAGVAPSHRNLGILDGCML